MTDSLRIIPALEERIQGCLLGAAIGAELGWTSYVRAGQFQRVGSVEELLALPLTPVTPDEEAAYRQVPYNASFLAPRLTPLIDIGVTAYVEKNGRATPEDFARALQQNRAIADANHYMWVLFYTTQELLNEGCNPRISGMGTVPSGLVADAMPAVGIFHHSDPEYAYLDGVELASVCQPRLGADWAGMTAAAIAAALAANGDPAAVVRAVLDLAMRHNEALFHEFNACVNATAGWFADESMQKGQIERWLHGFPCTQPEVSPLAPNPLRFVLPLLTGLHRNPPLAAVVAALPAAGTGAAGGAHPRRSDPRRTARAGNLSGDVAAMGGADCTALVCHHPGGRATPAARAGDHHRARATAGSAV